MKTLLRMILDKFQGTAVPSESYPTAAALEGGCRYCGEMGHWGNECPNRPETHPKKSVKFGDHHLHESNQKKARQEFQEPSGGVKVKMKGSVLTESMKPIVKDEPMKSFPKNSPNAHRPTKKEVKEED